MKILTSLILALILSSCGDDLAYPAEIPEETAVKCLLGEARGEGYTSLIAHSEALRNRGTLNGVYGCQVVLSPSEADFVRINGIVESARKAWTASKHTNIVKGAQFWGSTKVDGKWIAKMKKAGFMQTATVKNTIFFREVKK